MGLKIWLVTVGEPLPCEEGTPRLLRTGLLANVLHAAGHQVTWWTSSVDHQRKQFFDAAPGDYEVGPGFRLKFLQGRLYTRNISLARIRNHVEIACDFKRRCDSEPRPDVIVCSLPTTELAREVTAFGRRLNIPVAVDIRDLWPDVFLERFPKSLGWLAEPLLAIMRRDVRLACRQASAVIGLTDEFVDWGLAHAGRARRPDDAVFPMAYAPTEPPPSSIAEAKAFWRDHGLGSSDDEFIVMFFGVLGPYFEWDPITEVARALDGRSKLRFVICGDGDLLPDLRAKTAGLSNVILPGWIDQPKIWTLLRMGHLGMAPYQDIPNFRLNVPNKIAEYLSAGKPIVTCSAGAIMRLLRENDCGYYYSYGSANELMRALDQASGDRETLSTRSRNAKALFERSLSAAHVYGDFMRYLERLAGASSSARGTAEAQAG